VAAAFCFFCWAASAMVAAAEPTLTPPTGSLGAGEYLEITIGGITEADLPRTKLVLWPRDGTSIMPVKTWTGQPLVLFRAKTPGKYLLALSAAIGGELKSCETVLDIGGPAPPPTPVVNPYRPAPQFQPLCEPVTRIKLSRDDASRLAAIYPSALKASLAKPQPGPMLADLRAEIVRAGSALQLRGRYAGLSAAVDAALVGGLGLENVPIDQAKAAAFLDTLAWSIWEAGR
jgi:hypothetical protein